MKRTSHLRRRGRTAPIVRGEAEARPGGCIVFVSSAHKLLLLRLVMPTWFTGLGGPAAVVEHDQIEGLAAEWEVHAGIPAS